MNIIMREDYTSIYLSVSGKPETKTSRVKMVRTLKGRQIMISITPLFLLLFGMEIVLGQELPFNSRFVASGDSLVLSASPSIILTLTRR